MTAAHRFGKLNIGNAALKGPCTTEVPGVYAEQIPSRPWIFKISAFETPNWQTALRIHHFYFPPSYRLN
jgi:hypothetical protein